MYQKGDSFVDNIVGNIDVEISIAQCASELYAMQYAQSHKKRARALFALYSSKLIFDDLFHVKQYAFLYACNNVCRYRKYDDVEKTAEREFQSLIESEDLLARCFDESFIEYDDYDDIRVCKNVKTYVQSVLDFFIEDMYSTITLLPVRFPEICFHRYIEQLGYDPVKDCFSDNFRNGINVFA